MASRSLFFPFLRTQRQAQARLAYRAPSMQAIVVVFAILLILLLWTHFLLAMQIESMGRQNQSNAKELDKIGRENAVLRRQIAESTSQQNLSQRALELGYGLQTPIYLRLTEPLPEPQSDATGKRPPVPANGNGGETPTQVSSFLNRVAQTFVTSSETDRVP
jgi:cell division protein FtsB